MVTKVSLVYYYDKLIVDLGNKIKKAKRRLALIKRSNIDACPKCYGTGYITVYVDCVGIQPYRQKTCSRCKGGGYLIRKGN